MATRFLKVLLIRVWLGPLPPWFPLWQKHVKELAPYGFDFMVVTDYAALQRRFVDTLMVEPPPFAQIAGTRKAGDFDPGLGVLFEKEIRGYDYWGHCNLDCVYGRLDRMVTPEFLKGVDIWGNDPGAICGPLTLYRNCDKVNYLFTRFDKWKDVFTTDRFYGFDETEYNSLVQSSTDIRFKSTACWAHDKQDGHIPEPRISLLADGTLIDRVAQRETMMFHFNRPLNDGPFGGRRWPVSS